MGISEAGDALPGLDEAVRAGQNLGLTKPGPWPERVYVASSWRNLMQQAVCATFKAAGIPHYDFHNPAPGDEGFHWSEVGIPGYVRAQNNAVALEHYLAGLQHPRAVEGFANDLGGMQSCDVCVLVLPCGRSAHLEAGWFAGQPDRKLAVLMEDPIVPDLMYGLADYLAPSLFDLLGWLGVED